jgi:phospholipid-binding lipoprotein MlaA
MPRKTLHATCALIIAGFTLAGCATTGGSSQSEANPDPLEPLNRGVFAFNQGADKVILRPLARGYRAITPPIVRTGVTNFMDNLSVPRTLVNDLLQGKFTAAGDDLARLLINTTVGVGGLFDIASRAGIAQNNEDFGQTLATWGVPAGPYLMVPILGAYTLRDGFGEIGDWPLRPLVQIDNRDVRVPLQALYIVNLRTQLLGTDKLVEAAVDPYIFVRGAYLQRRDFLIHDGNPPATDDFDDDFDQDFSEEDFLNGE